MMPIRHRADRGYGSRTVLRLSDDRTVVPSTQGLPSSAPSTAPPADPDCPSGIRRGLPPMSWLGPP